MPRIWLLIGLSILLAGCGRRSSEGSGALSGQAGLSDGKPIITPTGAVSGQIVSVSQRARFVVINYPIGGLPAVEKRVSAYRNGLKVADLKISGPQRDTNIAADIISGECRVGDEVRDQ